MMKIRLIWPGKTKSAYIREGMGEFLKFLRAYANIEVVEFREGSGNREEVIKQESQRMLEKIPDNFILLDEKGENLTSIEFAQMIKNSTELNFVIGGVFGPSKEIKDLASRKIALSKMTLTHEMSRLLLLEQIYRALTIIKGKKYHY